MELRFDKEADAIYIKFSDEPYNHGKDLDDLRRVDYDAEDNPRGVELLCVSEGVITDDLPNRAEVEQALEDRGIKIFA